MTPLASEQVSLAVALLSRGGRHDAVADALRKKYGISYRSAARRIAEARVQMLEATKAAREQHIADALAHYGDLIRAGWSRDDLRLALEAQKAKDRITGAESPQRIDVVSERERQVDKALETLDDAARAALAEAMARAE